MVKSKSPSSALVLLALTSAASFPSGEADPADTNRNTTTTSASLMSSAPPRKPKPTPRLKPKLKSRKQSNRRQPPPPPREDERRLESAAAAPRCGGTSGTYFSTYLGCYDDKVTDRALPHEPPGYAGRRKNRDRSPLDCERECFKRGYKYFAREFKGQCFCGKEGTDYDRYGLVQGNSGGCDCCGTNVGSGIMCVWELGDGVVKRSAQPAQLPLPQLAPPVPRHPQKTHHPQITYKSDSSGGATHKPSGGFRVRLYWHSSFNWQNSRKEKYWCMECRGKCRNGDAINLDQCNHSREQKFIAMGKTIRPATDANLCITESGYGGKKKPVRLSKCDGGNNQSWSELRADGKFELQPHGDNDRCLSQHHHPRKGETVYPEKCLKSRNHDTTYWVTY